MEKIYFDSHTHTATCAGRGVSASEIISGIEMSELVGVVDVGFDMASSRVAAAYAARFDWCYAAVGIHPHDAEGMKGGDLRELAELFTAGAEGASVVAIGEIGLDFYRDLSPRDVQKEVFRRQIRLALELRAPIIIHDRESGGETVKILKEEGAFGAERAADFPAHADGGPDVRVLFHCYAGDLGLALWLVDQGATISIAGPVTYKNNLVAQEVAVGVPMERLLVETDAPYLTPVPLRGKPNRPWYVKHTADFIADLRGMDRMEFAGRTVANAKSFFGIDG